MVEKRNIIICGASFAGLSAAHHFLKHTYPSLKAAYPAAKYQVHLIDPSTHFYWRIAAPRACASPCSTPHNQLFTPISEGFRQYDEDEVVVHQGMVTCIDTARHTVTFIPATSTITVTRGSAGTHSETIPYHALVIASGTKTPSPMTSLHGEHGVTIQALDNMYTRLQHAEDIVISGGGPLGVELAGEIGEALNGVASSSKRRRSAQRARISLIVGTDTLLPTLSRRAAAKAAKILARAGVDVVHDARVTKVVLAPTDGPDSSYDPGADGHGFSGTLHSAAGGVETTRAEANPSSSSSSSSSSRRTTIHLSNGRSLPADVYIPATGVVPNTSFLPRELLNSDGYVLTNPRTLRVDAAGPGARVYCLGDVGTYSAGGLADLCEALPVVGANMDADLHAAAAAALALSQSFSGDSGVEIAPPGVGGGGAGAKESAAGGGASGKTKQGGAATAIAAAAAKEREYTAVHDETMLVPVGTKGGVGAVMGWSIPGFAVYMLKGKDYRIGKRFDYLYGNWKVTPKP